MPKLNEVKRELLPERPNSVAYEYIFQWTPSMYFN